MGLTLAFNSIPGHTWCEQDTAPFQFRVIRVYTKCVGVSQLSEWHVQYYAPIRRSASGFENSSRRACFSSISAADALIIMMPGFICSIWVVPIRSRVRGVYLQFIER